MYNLIVYWTQGDQTDAAHAVETMAKATVRRAPNAAGCWAEESAGIALSKRHLSISHLFEVGQ